MTRKIDIPTKKEILEHYAKEGNTVSSLARLYSVTNPTARSWLKQHGIERKTHKQVSLEGGMNKKSSKMPSKEELISMYTSHNLRELQNFYSIGQATLYEWLNFHQIEIKTLSEACSDAKKKQFEHIQFSKEYLEEQYDRTKPLNELANKLGVSFSHVKNLFERYGIEKTVLEKPWRSKAEIDLYDFCASNFPEHDFEYSVKDIIYPYELDIVCREKKIAIEYCGLVWHSEFFANKSKDYHTKKFQMCKEKGYKLLTIFESDDPQKVRSLLRTVFSKNERIYARNTFVMKLEPGTAAKFHNEHHLHGSLGGSVHLGLYKDFELVMVASFIKSRYSTKHQYECSRMTSHSNFTVVGGASKLFKHFVNEYDVKSLITYADLRYGEGNVYLNCKMERLKNTPPNYWYFKLGKGADGKLYSRVKFQKHKLKDQLEFYDENLTEAENMANNGWDRIWDCGNAAYLIERKKDE